MMGGGEGMGRVRKMGEYGTRGDRSERVRGREWKARRGKDKDEEQRNAGEHVGKE
jgi:hypothetical protein